MPVGVKRGHQPLFWCVVVVTATDILMSVAQLRFALMSLGVFNTPAINISEAMRSLVLLSVHENMKYAWVVGLSRPAGLAGRYHT